MIFLFIKGILIGLAIAAPVGPIGILCIQRTLRDGFFTGLMTGLGAATADAGYGFIAAFGLTGITALLVSYQSAIQIVGGIFLLYLGVKIFFSRPPTYSNESTKVSHWKSYVTTVFLTLTNPMTILSFIAIFAGLGLGIENHSYMAAWLIVVGVFVGSTLWWLLLSSVIAYFLRHRINQKTILVINRFSAVIILVFGVSAIVR